MKHHVTLPENIQGRDFVVGDIHGAFELLDAALEAVKFDSDVDRLISVGDLIDRGPESPRCIEFLEQDWFYSIKGNHEDMFLDACVDGDFDAEKTRYSIDKIGMEWALEEDKEILERINEAFKKLPIAIEVQTSIGLVGFVHADIPEGMDWQTFTEKLNENDKRTVETAVWSRKRIKEKNDEGVDGVDRVFIGHSYEKEGIVRLGNCYFIDTGAAYKLLQYEEAEHCSLTISDITANSANFNKKTDGIINIISIENPDEIVLK